MLTQRQLTAAARMRLSKNFTLREAIQTSHYKYVMWPNALILFNLKLGAQMILQPIRDRFGSIRINSGWRSFKINHVIGGSKTSDHMDGAAYDIVPILPKGRRGPYHYNVRLKQIYLWIQRNVPYRQVIWYQRKSFIHVSFNHSISYNGKFKPFKKQAFLKFPYKEAA